jgi:ACS family tartrate transporter-like MFS transporter
MEAIPTIIVGVFVLFLMTDKPERASWLNTEEKTWLTTTLEHERRAVERAGRFNMWQALVNPKILLLSINYLGIVTASLGVLLFLPQVIKSLGTTNMGAGLATTLAYVCGAISMMAWGWVSDRMGERRWNLCAACTVATIGLVLAGMMMGSWWALAGICIATAGFYGTKGAFWSMPSMLLTGTAAAAGIAWINSIGNVGGAVGPALVGWIKDFTGSYAGGFYGLAMFTGMSALIAAVALHIPRQVPVRHGLGVPAE